MDALVIFDPIQEQIELAREAVSAEVFDYEDPKQNKEARSLVAKVRKLKKPLTDAHKTAKADALAVCKALDEKKREYMSQIDELIDVHYLPIKAIDDRVAAEQERKDREERERLEAQRREQECKERELREREESIARKEREKEIAETAAKEAEKRAKEDYSRQIRIAEERAESERVRAEKAEQDKLRIEAEARDRKQADEARRAECLNETAECLNEMLDDPAVSRRIAEAIQLGYVKHVEFVY